MAKITDIKDKQPHCSFCGELEHKAYWGCPRIKSVAMDGDYWSVEFWHPEEMKADEAPVDT